MTKDVLLSITGLFTEDNETNDGVETLSPAQFHKKDEASYIFYEEIIEGVPGITKSRIKYSGKTLELIRRGELSVHLMFEEGKRTLNTYQMPLGNLIVGLDTKTVEIEEEEDEIRIHVDYSMEINYQHVSDNDIRIVVNAIKK